MEGQEGEVQAGVGKKDDRNKTFTTAAQPSEAGAERDAQIRMKKKRFYLKPEREWIVEWAYIALVAAAFYFYKA